MEQPLVSVIIPAYNSERFIEQTLSSVIMQSYSLLEIIVVDDGSTDGQKDIILNLGKTDSRIQYIHQSNKGVSAARNNGFLHSKGEYVAFLDADDIWLPDNVSEKLKKMESGDYGLVHSDASVINEKSISTGSILSGKEGMLLGALLSLKETQVPGPSSILLRREVMDKVGLFDSRLSTSADYDFFLRVSARFTIGRLFKITWKYRIHSSNMHKNISLMEKDMLYVFKKSSANGLFEDKKFEKRCYANLYMILAASWAKDGNNKIRGIYFTLLALMMQPNIAVNVIRRVLKK